jgi:hypothetical protein
MSNFVLILLTLVAAFLLGMWCGWPLHERRLGIREKQCEDRERKNQEITKRLRVVVGTLLRANNQT